MYRYCYSIFTILIFVKACGKDSDDAIDKIKNSGSISRIEKFNVSTNEVKKDQLIDVSWESVNSDQCILHQQNKTKKYGPKFQTRIEIDTDTDLKLVCSNMFSEDEKTITIKVKSDLKYPSSTNTVALHLADSGSRKGGVFCSGSLIDRKTVLTAAHCFIRYRKDLSKITVMFSADYKDPNAIHKSISSIITGADLKGKVLEKYLPTYDIAIVTLNDSAPTEYMPLPLLNDPELLEEVAARKRTAGYGEFRNGKNNIGKRVSGRASILEYYTGLQKGNILVKPIETLPCNAHSGGPLYIEEAGGWSIAGVLHGQNTFTDHDLPNDHHCKHPRLTYASVHFHREWVKSVINKSKIKSNINTTVSEKTVETLFDYCEYQRPDRESFVALKGLHLIVPGFSCQDLVKNIFNFEKIDFTTLDVYGPVVSLTPFKYITHIKELILTPDLVNDYSPLQSAVGLISLTGAIGSQKALDDIFGLKSIKNLKILASNYSNIDSAQYDWSNLINLTSIKKLDIRNHKIKALPELEGFDHLQDLNLYNNSLTNTSFLNPTKSIISLELGKNNLTSVKEIGNNQDLKYLSLRENSLTNVEHLSVLDKLEEIYLGKNPGLPKKCPVKTAICSFD